MDSVEHVSGHEPQERQRDGKAQIEKGKKMRVLAQEEKPQTACRSELAAHADDGIHTCGNEAEFNRVFRVYLL